MDTQNASGGSKAKNKTKDSYNIKYIIKWIVQSITTLIHRDELQPKIS